jgi:hypothetical protein
MSTNVNANFDLLLGTAVDVNSGNKSAGTLRVVLATDQPALTNKLLVTPDPTTVISPMVTVSTDVTRPADTNAYVAGDCWSDSTSAPTSGGFTFTSCASATGKSGIITDVFLCSSAPAALIGEVWIFDTAVTNVNDNAAFAISDSETKTIVAILPFAMTTDTNNSQCHLSGLNIGFTTVGSANLRFLIKVKSAYTPISAEVLTTRLKILQVN